MTKNLIPPHIQARVDDMLSIWEADRSIFEYGINKPHRQVRMRTIIVMMIYQNASVTMQTIADYVGYKDRANVAQRINEYRRSVFMRDPDFMDLLEPVKHLM